MGSRWKPGEIFTTLDDGLGRVDEWAVYGHVDDAAAIEAVRDYNCDDGFGLRVTHRGHMRTVPTGNEEDGGPWLIPCSGPARGASPVTWVLCDRLLEIHQRWATLGRPIVNCPPACAWTRHDADTERIGVVDDCNLRATCRDWWRTADGHRPSGDCHPGGLRYVATVAGDDVDSTWCLCAPDDAVPATPDDLRRLAREVLP